MTKTFDILILSYEKIKKMLALMVNEFLGSRFGFSGNPFLWVFSIFETISTQIPDPTDLYEFFLWV